MIQKIISSLLLFTLLSSYTGVFFYRVGAEEIIEDTKVSMIESEGVQNPENIDDEYIEEVLEDEDIVYQESSEELEENIGEDNEHQDEDTTSEDGDENTKEDIENIDSNTQGDVSSDTDFTDESNEGGGEENNEGGEESNEGEIYDTLEEDTGGSDSISHLINLNFASYAELVTISGIGNAIANNIISYREGSIFCELEDILNVNRVGPIILANIQEAGGYVEHQDCAIDNKIEENLDTEEENSEKEKGEHSENEEVGNDNLDEGNNEKNENGQIEEESEHHQNTHEDEKNQEIGNIGNEDENKEEGEEEIHDEEDEKGEQEENTEKDKDENGDETQTETEEIEDKNNDNEDKNTENYDEVYEDQEGDLGGMNLNFASHEELVSISGIGDAVASNIIAFRENNTFCYMDDVLSVNRVGPSILANIQVAGGYAQHPDCVYKDEIIHKENTSIGGGGGGGSENTSTKNIFQIIYEFQRPSDIELIPNAYGAYECDRTRQDCRVNLDYRASFSSDFPVRNFHCETDFGFGEITGEEQKCNPATVRFPLGVHQVQITMTHVSGEIHRRSFTVRNLGYQSPQERQEEAIKNGEVVGNIDIRLPRINIQNGIEAINETGRHFRCLSENCRMNINYTQRHSNERCIWDFGEGKQPSKTTHLRCNPGAIELPLGDHKITLTVYERNFESNRREFVFYVNNILNDENFIISENNKNDIIQNNKNIENIIHDIGKIDIALQGRIGNEKHYDSENQALYCVGVERCSVNLIANIEHKKRGLTYMWYKNGEILFENINPPAYWLEMGEYEIIFEIHDDDTLLGSSIFTVTVEGKTGKTVSSKSQKQKDTEPSLFDALIHDGIIIYDFLADPIGSDMKEFIDIKNTNSEPRDLYGCYLEDNGRRKFRFPQGSYLEGGEVQSFFRVETRMVLGNTSGRISLFCNNEEVQNITWESKVREGISYRGKYIGVFQPQYLLEKLDEEMYERYVTNVFAFSARALKYDGLRVRGETLPHSTLSGYIDGQRFFELTTGSSGEYMFDTKYIRAGTHQVEFILTDKFGNTFELRPRTFTLQAERMAYWFTPRLTSTPRTPVVRFGLKDVASSNMISPITQDIILRRFFIVGVIILASLIGLWHLFLLAFPPSMALRELQVRTRTRTEIIFLLPSS